jgi:hypothetical protein
VGEHRDGGVVGVQHAAGADMTSNRCGERRQQELGLPHPIREGRAVELDAFARIDDGLAVQRGVVGELRDQDVGDQAGAGQSTFDRQATASAPARWFRRTGNSAWGGCA